MDNDMFDLSGLEYCELAEAGDLLKAYAEHRPADWFDEGVKLACNRDHGTVFLVNEDGQVLMLHGDKAEQFYGLGYSGLEGFADKLYADFRSGNVPLEDLEELADILSREGMDVEAQEVDKARGGGLKWRV